MNIEKPRETDIAYLLHRCPSRYLRIQFTNWHCGQGFCFPPPEKCAENGSNVYVFFLE